MNCKQVGGTKVMAGTRTFDLLESKKPEDQKAARRMMEFTRKAESCNYELSSYTKLRNEFKDVL